MASTAPADHSQAPFSDSHACAHRGAPATLTCAACKDAPAFEDEVEPKWYCNADCQKADWSAHKSLCKKLSARKKLSRAADTLQSLWYIFREETFDWDIVDVKLNNGVHYLINGDLRTAHQLDKSYRRPFPNQLMTDESMKKALLTHMQGTEALGYLHNTIARLLEGLYEEISEVRLKVKNECKKLRLKSVQVYGRYGIVDEVPSNHQLLMVKLKSGETYIVDITGAQYGLHRTIVPWAEYMPMVHSMEGVKEFGFAQRRVRWPLGRRNVADLVRRYYDGVDQAFENVLADALKLAGGLSLAGLIALPETTFRKKRTQILEHVQAGLRLAAEAMDTVTVGELAAKHNIGMTDADLTGLFV